jgi:PAS domain S-box-containing protein
MIEFFRRRSLANLIAASLVAVTTLLVGTYFVIDYFSEANYQKEVLANLTNVQVDETCVAVALPVWNLDKAQIEKVIEAMARPLSIYGITVTAAGKTYGRVRVGVSDESAFAFAVRHLLLLLQPIRQNHLRDRSELHVRRARGHLIPWNGEGEPPGMLVREAPINFGGHEIGKVRLVVTLQGLRDDLFWLRVRLIATIVVVDLLLVLCVYFLLSRVVVRPIRAVERFAVAVSGGGHYYGETVPLPAAELESLRHSIETMVRLLDSRYVELQNEMARRMESEDRFLSIFDSVNDAILVQDRETTAVVDANQRACEMFGYTHEEMLTLRSRDLSSGEGGFTEEQVRVLFSSTQELNLVEWQSRHHDGHLFWCEASLRMAMIGGESRAIIAARDITQRKQMEEALRQSERMSTIGELVAGVAHEVRNPLFGIAATLDAFEAEFGVSDVTDEYMTTLRNDVSRLTRLMNDLLEYGRPQGIVPHVQSIVPVIAEAVRVCALRARERQIEIRQHVEFPLPQVAIDSDRMLQVLKNVVENAIEFSRAGEAVALDAYADHRNGSSALVFSVVDSGPGFRLEDLPHVFEPFFTRRRGGSGLGLAIAQKIVADHGGHITASNAEAGGARIDIRIPAG